MRHGGLPGRIIPQVGLCSVCIHARTVENRRGSAFYLCERSKTDPSFSRYPRLPVLACRGFEAVDMSQPAHEAGDEPPDGSGDEGAADGADADTTSREDGA